jgi:hypothetical protein
MFAHQKREGEFFVRAGQINSDDHISLSPYIAGTSNKISLQRQLLLLNKKKYLWDMDMLMNIHNHPSDSSLSSQFFSYEDTLGEELLNSAMAFVPVTSRSRSRGSLDGLSMTVVFSRSNSWNILHSRYDKDRRELFNKVRQDAISAFARSQDRGTSFYRSVLNAYRLIGKIFEMDFSIVNFVFCGNDRVTLSYDPDPFNEYSLFLDREFRSYIELYKPGPLQETPAIFTY